MTVIPPDTKPSAATPLAEIPALIPQWARALGFADAGVSSCDLDADADHLRAWLAQSHNGDMAWMARDPAMRHTPAQLHPGTVSVISARLPYRPAAADAMQVLDNGELAYVSRYALGRDYHKLMRARLRKLAQRIEQAVGPHGYRVFADSAPSLEKAIARDATRCCCIARPVRGSFSARSIPTCRCPRRPPRRSPTVAAAATRACASARHRRSSRRTSSMRAAASPT
jgi:hypothetical protein